MRISNNYCCRTFQGLLKALIWLGSQSYGSMYVNFGHPISFRAMLENELEAAEKLGAATDYDVFMKAVKQTAEATVLSHQHCLRVPMFSAVCFILLSKVDHIRHKNFHWPHWRRLIFSFDSFATAAQEIGRASCRERV